MAEDAPLAPSSTRRNLLKTGAAVGAAAAASVAGGVATSKSAYGAVTVGLPYTVVDNPVDANAGFDAWLANRSATGFPKTKLVFAFIGTAVLSRPLLASTFTGPQIQGARIEGLSKRGTVLQWASTTTPLFQSNGKFRNWELKDLTFKSAASVAAPAKGLLFVSDSTASNQDGKFQRIEFMGPWDYGLAFDGPATANLNSEIVCDQLACSADASFGSGLFVTGLSGNDAQEDQFLNYVFRDCKLEGSHGNYLVFNKGGSVTLAGMHSWLHTGESNGGVPAGTMISMPVTSHFDSVQTLVASGHLRVEMRGTDSVFLDCGWNGSGRIVILGLDTGGNAFKFKTLPGVQDIILRNGCHLNLVSPSLGGYIGLRDKGGAVVLQDPKLVAGCSTLDYTSPSSASNNGVVRNFVVAPNPAPPAPQLVATTPL